MSFQIEGCNSPLSFGELSFTCLVLTKDLAQFTTPKLMGCVNSVLKQHLRCYTSYQQDNWTDLLPFAEVAYKNSVHIHYF